MFFLVISKRAQLAIDWLVQADGALVDDLDHVGTFNASHFFAGHWLASKRAQLFERYAEVDRRKLRADGGVVMQGRDGACDPRMRQLIFDRLLLAPPRFSLLAFNIPDPPFPNLRCAAFNRDSRVATMG